MVAPINLFTSGSDDESAAMTSGIPFVGWSEPRSSISLADTLRASTLAGQVFQNHVVFPSNAKRDWYAYPRCTQPVMIAVPCESGEVIGDMYSTCPNVEQSWPLFSSSWCSRLFLHMLIDRHRPMARDTRNNAFTSGGTRSALWHIGPYLNILFRLQNNPSQSWCSPAC
jgi:hypothetical protein